MPFVLTGRKQKALELYFIYAGLFLHKATYFLRSLSQQRDADIL